MASSSSCSADNEEHFGSDDSEDDSDESDEESKALFSRLVQVASRHFAKVREPARATNTPSTPVAIKQEVVPVPPLPEIDDEETETE
ncbi:hypothetical protein P3T76_000824 [Phytophthora citrophthora]|uniref:Uncharacterized protein n=1 Tax=Phytophthora citrophthora TaxID=4793 RepID=A0AAD9H0R5_9STRA|nr:hypothetical protein P3T76_000824 [Phytophthora citrophthora]